MTVRFAFVGFQHGHIESLFKAAEARPDVAITGVCEEDDERREALSERYTFTHSDFDAMLAEAECDVVAVGDYFGKRGALIIKAMSRGPVFYRQDRIGHMGKKFTLLKFRTMLTNATEDTHKNFVTSFINGSDTVSDRGSEKSPVYKLQLDPRITPVGRFLRKWSLDELPQLFNILKGEMAIVGPRPPIPYEVEQYKPWHLGRIYDVKPGLTGLWQVSGRSRTSFEEMVRLDLQYVNHWSLGYDLKIVFKTLFLMMCNSRL